ncbi:MAG: serine protease [Planctomycetota bacterium JB042]
MPRVRSDRAARDAPGVRSSSRILGTALAAAAGAALVVALRSSSGTAPSPDDPARATPEIEIRLRERLESARRDARDRESALEERIAALEHRLARADLASPLRPIARGTERSIYLLRCSYAYRVRGRSGAWRDRRATSWGTAFCVTDEGHLVTNKHLVEPWKFDPELTALVAWGEAEIGEGSPELHAWPAGARCVDAEGAADPGEAYSNTPDARRRLTIASRAPDVFDPRTSDLAGLPIRHDVHRLDANDLVILRLEGGGTFVPLPCVEGESAPPTRRLDPVLTIGFPRGGRGLDRNAEPSFATGVVRRVGEQIHTTIPMVSGNSGGPVLDERGRVIGVATFVYEERASVSVRIGAALALLTDAKAPSDDSAAGVADAPSVEELDPPLATR